MDICVDIIAGIFIPFYKGFMIKPSLLQAESKPTCSAKQLKGINHDNHTFETNTHIDYTPKKMPRQSSFAF